IFALDFGAEPNWFWNELDAEFIADAIANGARQVHNVLRRCLAAVGEREGMERRQASLRLDTRVTTLEPGALNEPRSRKLLDALSIEAWHGLGDFIAKLGSNTLPDLIALFSRHNWTDKEATRRPGIPIVGV